MTQNISLAPHGLNLVIETTSGRVIIGRFDSTNGFQVLMHDCDVYDPPHGADPDAYIRETATYGEDVPPVTCTMAVTSRLSKMLCE